MILQYKNRLKELGLNEKDTICFLMRNSLELVVLYFASLLSELTVAPLDPSKGTKEIGELLSYMNYKIIIHDTNYAQSLKKTVHINKFNSLEQETDPSKLDDFLKIDYNKVFLITFTSGSTGIPKGVMHSFNNLMRSAMAFKKQFNFDRNNTFYHNLPMSYMAGILNLIILPFISQSKIVIGERFEISNISEFWDTPIKYCANTFWFIPTILSLLLKLDRNTKGLEYANKTKIIGCVGTATLNPMIKTEFENKYNIHLYESYGLSETLFVSSNYPLNDQQDSVGKLLEGVQIEFASDEEILIMTPWMFLGYDNLKNQDYFEKGKYLSGDLGRLDEKGFLKITGRKKDLIIRGGINVSPKKIEDFISSLDIFEESVVLGYEDRYLGERTVCFYIPKSSYSEEVRKQLNLQIVESLGRDYHIDEFIRVDEIPKNINSKIDKPKIRATFKLQIE